MSNYREKLKDPRWQKKLLEILNRDEWQCKSCQDNESTLHVHHRYYLDDREPWDYPDYLLVTLCESCHEEETEMMERTCLTLINMMKDAGALQRDVFRLVAAFFTGRDGGDPLQFSEPDWTDIANLIRKISKDRKENNPC